MPAAGPRQAPSERITHAMAGPSEPWRAAPPPADRRCWPPCRQAPSQPRRAAAASALHAADELLASLEPQCRGIRHTPAWLLDAGVLRDMFCAAAGGCSAAVAGRICVGVRGRAGRGCGWWVAHHSTATAGRVRKAKLGDQTQLVARGPTSCYHKDRGQATFTVPTTPTTPTTAVWQTLAATCAALTGQLPPLPP